MAEVNVRNAWFLHQIVRKYCASLSYWYCTDQYRRKQYFFYILCSPTPDCSQTVCNSKLMRCWWHMNKLHLLYRATIALCILQLVLCLPHLGQQLVHLASQVCLCVIPFHSERNSILLWEWRRDQIKQSATIITEIEMGESIDAHGHPHEVTLWARFA